MDQTLGNDNDYYFKNPYPHAETIKLDFKFYISVIS
jgi:hypothetical protein